MIIKTPEQVSPNTDRVVYPVIDRHLWDERTGYNDHEIWHDLMVVDDVELSMMGTALIGNVCCALHQGLVTPYGDAALTLKGYATDEGKTIPWPGMPDDSPLPLDLTALPFEPVMFLGEKNTFRKRVDRMALGRRIEEVWVPYIRDRIRIA